MRVSVEEAVKLIRQGQVVAIPTETVYGLAAGLHQPEAVERIFSLKGRPVNNPLIVHAASFEEVQQLCGPLSAETQALANAFWPGPLTLVLPAHETIPAKVRAGLPSVAVRIPNHPLALALLKAAGPVVAPSANLSGRPSATTPAHVEEDFGDAFPVLDGEACQRGLESTILGLHNGRWEVFRLGSIPAEAFQAVLGYVPGLLKLKKGESPLCPGQLYRHYAPKARLILSEQYSPCEAIVGYLDRTYPAGPKLFYLGHSDNPIEVSQALYAVLRQLDQSAIATAWVDMDIPQEGLWQTMRERIQKASFKDDS